MCYEVGGGGEGLEHLFNFKDFVVKKLRDFWIEALYAFHTLVEDGSSVCVSGFGVNCSHSVREVPQLSFSL